MPKVLVVADAEWILNDVRAALSRAELIEITAAPDAVDAMLEHEPDAAVVDLQVGSMGGMAITRALRDASDFPDDVPVVLLLDRSADSFLAKRAGAATWVQKPFTAHQLRTALDEALTPIEEEE